jgi:urease accessory protein UreF
MLSWSATETAQPVDIASIVDHTREPRLDGGRELIALARAIRATQPDRRWLDAVADTLDLDAAVDAAAVAANFQIMNRTVDATGLHVGRHFRDQNQWIIDALGLDRFPHAAE